jgi:hypothetical protein
VQFGGKNFNSIKQSIDFNCSSLGCPGALSKINKALAGKFCFLNTTP